MEITQYEGGSYDWKWEKKQELLTLGQEMFERREAIVQEYKRTHTLPSRGIIDTPELRAMQKEEKRRFIEICEKYKE